MSSIEQMRGQVKGYLDRIGWHYNDSDGRLRFGVDIECKLGSIRMVVSFTEKGYLVCGYIPLKARDDVRDEVMRYITMVNYRLRNGSFDMDLSDGEIFFRVYSHYLGLVVLPDEVIDESVMIVPFTVDLYGDGLAAVIMGFATAEEAMTEYAERREAIEGGGDDEDEEDDDEDGEGPSSGGSMS